MLSDTPSGSDKPEQPEQPEQPDAAGAPSREDLPEAPSRPYASLPGAYVAGDGLAGSAGPGGPGGPAGTAPTRPGAPRSRVRVVVAAVAVAALVAVVGLVAWRAANPVTPTAQPVTTSSATGPAASATPTPGATSTRPAAGGYPAELADYYTQRVAWKGCSDNPRQLCGTLEVPVDYTKPQGDRFTLALRKAPATDPSRRVGSLLVNPGGPGGSGVEYAQYSSFVFSPAVRAAYDIVGFDPRGIGASDAVSCLTDSDMDRLFSTDPTPDTPEEKKAVRTTADSVARSCAARGGQRVLHMSSTEVARDMDVMRVVFGDSRLNFFGGSYGTFLGAIYADTFPGKVGRMVLDSAMSPNQTDAQETTYDIQGFEASIDAFIDWCVARPDCALGSDKATARGKIADLLDAVEKHGLTTTKPGLTRIGEGWVGFSIFMCLYSDSSWPTLNRGLAQAFAGRGDILLAKGMSVVERSATGKYATSSYLQAMLPVRCADWPRSKDTPATLAEQARLKKAHPLWAKMTGELYDSCAAWPTPGRTPKGTTLAVGAAPILVIGNERDPATPIGGTKQLAKDLASGVLLTSDHDGHGTYYAGNSCVDQAVDGYLVQGKVPTDGTTC
jgi:pimeloyl-ACP methyl ester carboxylesterase